MEKKKTIAEMRKDIQDMITASKRRQKGKDVTSEDIRRRMEKRELEKAKEDFKTQKKKARQAGRPFSTPKDKSQYVAPNGKEYMGPGRGPKRERKAKKEEAPNEAPRRRPTGREEIIAQRYMDHEKRKKEGNSSVMER